MVMGITHIDKISRELGRDVLFLEFSNSYQDPTDWERPNHPRQHILAWMTENNIAYRMCAHIASEEVWISYRGWIYIDVPYDTSNPDFQRLSEFLEDSSGKILPEHGDTKFCVVTLEQSMKNAHHDEPGFWERWAENF
jgi:hypothetical protein